MRHETSSWAAARTNVIAKALRDMAVVAYRRCAVAPPAAIARALTSIRRHPRHPTIEGTRGPGLLKKLFGSRHRALSRHPKDSADSALASIEVPQEQRSSLPVHPPTLTAEQWDQLFAGAVIPCIVDAHPALLTQTALIWHADIAAAVALTRLLQAEDPHGPAGFLDELVGQGASSEALYTEVVEATARLIGRLYDDDRLNPFEVTVALARLQIEVRRLGPTATTAAGRYASGLKSSILIAPHPGEPHGLGAAMACELFLDDGWDVTCEYPSDDAALCGILRSAQFDVLELALSPSLPRGSEREAVKQTIRAAREASLNSSLIVVVYGQAFVDAPFACDEVGADFSCGTVVDCIPRVRRLCAAVARQPYSPTSIVPPVH